MTESTKHVYIMVGYPGSGKTTWAAAQAQQGFVRIDGDILKTPERMIRAAEAALPKAQHGIIFDSTGGTKDRRGKFIAFAKAHGLSATIVWIKTSMEESMVRNTLRTKPVPAIAYYTYRKKFEDPCPTEAQIKIL